MLKFVKSLFGSKSRDYEAERKRRRDNEMNDTLSVLHASMMNNDLCGHSDSHSHTNHDHISHRYSSDSVRGSGGNYD